MEGARPSAKTLKVLEKGCTRPSKFDNIHRGEDVVALFQLLEVFVHPEIAHQVAAAVGARSGVLLQ